MTAFSIGNTDMHFLCIEICSWMQILVEDEAIVIKGDRVQHSILDGKLSSALLGLPQHAVRDDLDQGEILIRLSKEIPIQLSKEILIGLRNEIPIQQSKEIPVRPSKEILLFDGICHGLGRLLHPPFRIDSREEI